MDTLKNITFFRVLRSNRREDKFLSRYFDHQVSYRYLLQLADGNTIETSAYLHYLRGQIVDIAIDISSMIGCPMQCKFCESGSIAYVRALHPKEMLEQFFLMCKLHDSPEIPKILCSFQGIGEPSLIADTIIDVSQQLLELDTRCKISISTIGSKLSAFKLWRDSSLPIDNLQISSSGSADDQIARIMPRTPDITALIEESTLSLQSENIQKVKFNYILIKGINDTDRDVERLIELFRHRNIIVKISCMNETQIARYHHLASGDMDRAIFFAQRLQEADIDSYVFGAFNSIDISCGQLAFVTNGNIV